MIKRKEEIFPRVVEAAQGGEKEVIFYDWLTEECAKKHGRLFSKIVIPPEASIGFHQHQGEFEAYLVLSGEGLLNDNGSISKLKEGDMHLCREGDSHGIKNDGPGDLVLLATILNQ